MHARFGGLTRLLVALVMTIGVALASIPSAEAKTYPPPPWGEPGLSEGEDLEIELVTFGPGSDIASWFGHSALVVRDKRLRQTRVYNYGMFTFHDQLILEFLTGRLNFWVGESPYMYTLRRYAAEDRYVHINVLNMTPEKRVEVARALAVNVLPENRAYLYHHYWDNCSTRVRDMIDLATDGQFNAYAASTPSRMSLRDHTLRFATLWILGYGMMFAEAHQMDDPITVWEEMFLPPELELQVDTFEYTLPSGERVPLTLKKEVFHKTELRAPVRETPPNLYPWWLLMGVLFGLGSYGSARMLADRETRTRRIVFGLYQATLGLVFGGAGMILVLFLFTDHFITHYNENMFLVNPLTFSILPVGLMVAFGSERARTWLIRLWYMCAAIAALGIALKVLPWFYQNNGLTLSIVVPMLLGSVLGMRTLKRTMKERVPTDDE
ncbi:MAG: DUF4105 domain-containing protein [Myxococcota bacterium]